MLELNRAHDLQRLKEQPTIKKSKTVELVEQRKRRPRMIMYDVSRNATKENLQAALAQNELEGEGEVQFLFQTGPREDTEKCHWVVEVTPRARTRLLNTGRFFYEFTSHRVKDFVVATRCMKCMKYGHIAKVCQSGERCTKCGDNKHKTADCKKDGCCPTCGPDQKCDGKRRSCPSYTAAIRRLIDSTDYGE